MGHAGLGPQGRFSECVCDDREGTVALLLSTYPESALRAAAAPRFGMRGHVSTAHASPGFRCVEGADEERETRVLFHLAHLLPRRTKPAC